MNDRCLLLLSQIVFIYYIPKEIKPALGMIYSSTKHELGVKMNVSKVRAAMRSAQRPRLTIALADALCRTDARGSR